MGAERKIWLRALLLSSALLALDDAHADKLYKWTDGDGKLHYTDHAPTPAEAKRQERRKFGNKPADVAIPYALQRAIKNFPATLYNADCGEPCTKAGALLAKRGVPYTEKNARDAAVADELKALNGGKVEVPFLKLGTQILRGFEEGGWNQALDAAGYPTSAVLPPKVAAKTPTKTGEPAKPPAPKASEPVKEDKPAAPEDKPAPAPSANPSQ